MFFVCKNKKDGEGEVYYVQQISYGFSQLCKKYVFQ